MRFVNPNFLWALSLLAIPIIIHLFHFRRYKKVLFPNVKFLKSVQRQTQSIKKVRNLLVLLARLLAVAFLVFAFAQPFIPVDENAIQANDQVIGVYLDNSFSTDNQGEQGPLIEEAKEKARKLIKSYSPTDRFIVSTNTSTSITALNQEDAIAAIDNTIIQKTSKPLTDAVMSIENAINQETSAPNHIYLFSDFQKEKAEKAMEAIDSTTRISIVPLVAKGNNNISIDTAWIESPVLHLNEITEIKVTLTNHGANPLNGGSLSLDVNGQRKAVTGFDLQENASQTIKIGFALTQGGWQQLQLSVEDNPIVFDDSYYLSFNVKPEINVLTVNGNESNKYIQKLYGDDGYYKLTERNAGNIDLNELNNSDLLILNEVSSLRTGIISAIGNFIQTGGNVLIIPPKQGNESILTDFTASLALPKYGKKIVQSTQVGRIDLENDLFKNVFDKLPENMNLPTVEAYYALQTAGTPSYSLLQLENEDVLLTANKIGTGNVYQLAVPLEEKWSNFQRHALFVPILLKMALNKSIDYPHAYTISNQNIVKAVPELKSLQGEISASLNEKEWMPVINAQGSSSYVDLGYDEVSAGNLALKTKDSLYQIVAMNFDRTESSNQFYTTDELAVKLSGLKMDIVENTETYVKDTVSKYRYGKQFWKTCIILALLFIAIEILLLRFWPTEVKQ